MMMRRRTTDGKAWLAGRSEANLSKQRQGKAVQWGTIKDRVHTRLAGHTARRFKKKRTSFLLLLLAVIAAAAPSLTVLIVSFTALSISAVP